MRQSACQCTYCCYERREDREEVDAENDRLIGWPGELQIGDADSEYPLQLCGFSKASRDDIMYALLTLTRHGIRLADLNAGVAHAPPGEQMKEQEENRDESLQRRLRETVNSFPL